ncbi:MAG: Holliday junction branch migration protein RuvA [Candidatus Gracilibacteria bacterium]|nr:Holliday junction branch migration protein RuvA [Candidatus Gracilibacteria bacterium]
MFSYIKGEIINIENNKLDILAQNTGIGFEVFVSNLTLHELKVGNFVELYIYHNKTENSEDLFGFPNLKEKLIFKNLLKISGVGGKMAINILGLGTNTLLKAIDEGDEKMLSTISGVGKKIALKIILEMKNNAGIGDIMKNDGKIELQPAGNMEIIITLTNMGYDKKSVEEVLRNLPEGVENIQEKTIFCIRALGRK